MSSFSSLLAHLPRHVRGDPADPAWPDRDRLVRAGEIPPFACPLAMEVPGPPGQAFGAAVGLALAERLLAARFGRSLIDHRTWLIAGAAELAAGTAQEAAAIAGGLKLGRLTVLAELPEPELPALARFTALGWTVRLLHDGDNAAATLTAATRGQKPTLIICAAGQAEPAADPLPDPALAQRGAGARRGWLKRVRRHAQADALHAVFAGRLSMPPAAPDAPATPAAAPAAAIAAITARLALSLPEWTLLPPEPGAPDPGELATISWAGRGQALAAAVLGMALHGGLLPAARLDLRDAEPVRPVLRAAAALNLRCVFLLTEQGPACSVGGQRAAWRAMRNLLVLRPADGAEAAECLAIALRRTAGPCLLLLGTNPTKLPPEPPTQPRACARGGYRLLDPPRRHLTLITSGPELRQSLHLAAALARQNLHAAVVSLPCWTLFAAQDATYREATLGTAPRIALEAGSGLGWTQWLGEAGLFLDTEGHSTAHTLLPPILRHLGRDPSKPAIQETQENLLETPRLIG